MRDGELSSWIRAHTGAVATVGAESIQSLWSGYGQVLRVALRGAVVESVIVKRVEPPTRACHPRGWNTSTSHERKLRSYDVETVWYRDYAARCDEHARVPRCYDVRHEAGSWLFLLEDLDASGFPERSGELSGFEAQACLRWLAEFHATFLDVTPDGLWEVGTYWHLATRLDELERVTDPVLRDAAPTLDARLSDCRFKTLVHGDAKVANFCFSRTGKDVAAVDFQYVGGGCGIKDVAYFLSSCMEESECEAFAARCVDEYFRLFREAVARRRPGFPVDELEREWRSLYAVAWADFYRFLVGWSPGHWKIHGYSRRQLDLALSDD